MTVLALKLSDISKRFPGVLALNGVGLECVVGEIHAVVGENGSGKSTMLGIASGALAPDSGSVEILGQRLTTPSPALARKLGVATVYQDNSLVLELTVAQNLYLGTFEPVVGYRGIRAWTCRQLERYGLTLDPDARAGDLSPSQRQLLEVVKALVLEPRVLLLDEPTTALDSNDVDMLHGIVRHIVANDATVVYVSHRLPEILSLADRVTVLRDGEGQGTYDAAALSEDALIALMVGRPIEAEFPPTQGARVREAGIVLSVRDLSGDRFNRVSFDAYRGEILGFAGAEGNGQRDVLRGLGGFEQATGHVTCDGRKVALNAPRRVIEGGITMLSGDRATESIFPPLGVRENMTVQVLDDFAVAGFVRARKERERALGLIDEFNIVTPALDQPIGSLSGGNQQKAVLARSFLHGASVFLIEEPTQGVDAKARFDIYQALRAKAGEGVTFIVKSADAIELAGLCDRVLVFSRGRIVRELQDSEVTEANIVSSFLTSKSAQAGSAEAAEEKRQPGGVLAKLARVRDAWWAPLAFLVLIITLVAAEASARSPAFLTPLNGRHLLLAVAPLGLVAMAQLCALLVGGFDISVGSIMSLTVVIASFVLGSGGSLPEVLGGAALCIACGVLAGAANAAMIRLLRINPVITTIATLSVLQGIALYLRPVPSGLVNSGFMHALTLRLGFVPYSFYALLVLAILGDFWLYRTKSGLRLRSVGFREQAATRNGIWANMVHFRAYMLSGGIAALAGLFLATEVGVGHPTVGSTYTLTSIAAAVLGGASLAGGRGSFVGALLGAIFFALVINVLPFLGIDTALGTIVRGALTLLAVLMYSGRLPVGWLRKYFSRETRGRGASA